MDSGVDWNSEYNRDSIAWLMNDIGSSILGKGIGGADGLKKSGKKKSKLKQTTKLTKPAYFKTSFINKKIIAEFKMTLSGKEGKNVQVELKPWILTEEGKVEYAPNGLGPKIVQVRSEKLYDLNEEQMQNYSQKSNYKEDIFNLPFELQRTPINIEVCVEVPDNVVITLIANLIIN